ncbi:hypothetical protein Aph01nite_34470 [Acrocarpospora phusangensis]|uniref:Tape measure protein n=1 Tax=Acrocarpospora phusangensis TaxID=1070424 RepID=A0A919QF67_9ACTN|nr:hypothetical protein [Acrocarpospora phusangensis]GIH25137.1 hypothetical protein Aph01nite_34470 [Acrocarpospora phusangensis]
MPEGFKIADAWVDIHARGHEDVGREVRDEIRGDRNFQQAGTTAGAEFGAGFTRSADGRLRDARGRFAAAHREMGRDSGQEFGRGLGDGIDRQRGRLLARLGDLGSGLGRSLIGGLTGSLAGLGGVLTGSLKLTTLAGGVAAIGAAAASAAGFVTLFVAELMPLLGITAALPGLALSAAAAISVWKLATGGLGEAMAAARSGNLEALAAAVSKLSDSGRAFINEYDALIPRIHEFKAAAQDAFLSQINGQLARWLTALSALQPAIAALGQEFGGLVRRFLDFGTAPGTIGQVNAVLGDTRTLVAAVGAALTPLLTGFTDLGVAGSSWLASFAPGLQNMLTTFGEWMSQIAASGQATAWMNSAVDVLKQVGAVLGDIGGIGASVFKAMETAGGSALGVVGQLLDGVNQFLASAEGQTALVEIFGALGAAGRAFMPVLKDVFGALGQLAPTVAGLAEVVGPVLSGAVQAVTPALQALGPGIAAVFGALGVTVRQLADSGALTTMAEAFGALLIALAPLLPALAQVLIPVLNGLAVLTRDVVAPALSTLVGWIRQGVDWLTGKGLSEDSWLGRMIANIRDTVLPIASKAFETVKTIFTDVVAWFTDNQETVSGWGEKLGSIFSKIGEIVTSVFELIGAVWNRIGQPLLDAVGGIFGGILDVVDGILTAIGGVFDVFIGIFTGDWSKAWEGVKKIFSGVWDALKGLFTTAWEALKGVVNVALAAFGTTWEKVWNGIKDFFTDTWDKITGAIGRAKDFAVEKFTQLLTWIKELPGKVLTAIGDLGALLVDTGKNLVTGLWNGILGAWDWFKTKIGEFFGALLPDWAKDLLGIASPSTVFAEMGGQIPAGLVQGIQGQAGQVAAAAAQMAEAAMRGAQAAGEGLVAVLRQLADGLPVIARAITSVFSGVLDWLNAAVTAVSRAAHVIGQNLIIGFWNGMNSQFDWLRSAIHNFFSAIMPQWVRDALGIRSPSVLFAEKVGRWIPPGVAKGISDNSAVVRSAGRDMVEQAMAGAAAVMSGAGPVAGATAAGARTVNIDRIEIRGVWDFTDPIAARNIVRWLREELRRMEAEYG